MENHEDYFIGTREPIASVKGMRIYRGNGTIYLKGVKVGQVENGHYSYEFDHLHLTEDRTIRFAFCLDQDIGKHIIKSTDREFIREFINSPKDSFEKETNIEGDWSSEFESELMGLWKKSPTKISSKWIEVIRSKKPNLSWEPEDMTASQIADLDRAKDFLGQSGYPVTAQVSLVRNDDSNCIAFQAEGKIFLTARSFERGTFYLAQVIFEEQSHCHGFKDFSRKFQSYLIQQILIHSKSNLNLSL